MSISRKVALASLAIVLAAVSAAWEGRAAHKRQDASPLEGAAPQEIEPFVLASILSESPPDAVVISLDEARHPLRGAAPIGLFGGTDDTLVANAPRGRHIVLAARDVVRQDRLARQLLKTGRDVAVLSSGLEGWDRIMDADPPAPSGTRSEAVWQSYRTHVALRRSFGDAAPALATPVAAPVAPATLAGGSATKKREGC